MKIVCASGQGKTCNLSNTVLYLKWGILPSYVLHGCKDKILDAHPRCVQKPDSVESPKEVVININKEMH